MVSGPFFLAMKKAKEASGKMRQRHSEMSEDWFGDGWCSKGDCTWRFRILSKWIVTRVITPISGLYVP